jgi:1,4-dihydroxy-2-naphthoate octaprenyltransferase
VFSALLFALAGSLLFVYFGSKNQLNALLLFFVIMLPVFVQLLLWFKSVRQNVSAANFENTMKMNLLASSCMNIYFLILICNHFLAWF